MTPTQDILPESDGVCGGHRLLPRGYEVVCRAAADPSVASCVNVKVCTLPLVDGMFVKMSHRRVDMPSTYPELVCFRMELIQRQVPSGLGESWLAHCLKSTTSGAADATPPAVATKAAKTSAPRTAPATKALRRQARSGTP